MNRAARVRHPVVPWPTPVPNQPNFVYSSGPDGGQWWIHVGCRRCQDTVKKPCNQPERTGYWVIVYISTHTCRTG